MRIGLIGVGNIGFHIGNRLLAMRHELLVHDRSADAQARIVSSGAQGVSSAEELAAGVEIVLLCLPMPHIVADVASRVVEGSAMRILVDLSTTGPSATKEVAAVLEARGVALV